MADPFVAEIRIFPFNFAPKGWAFCDGQIMPISQNTALFALLGTTYGGDGKSTFGLPDLQGRVPMHPDEDWVGSQHLLGESGGFESVTLLQSEIPAHTHGLLASTDAATFRSPSGSTHRAVGSSDDGFLFGPPSNLDWAAPQALAPAGGSLPHENMQPYVTFNFCIALQGVFPPRW